MEKFSLIKKILFTGLLAASSTVFAADLSGDYCTPAGVGTLVMRFAPTTDANHGTLTIFNVSNRGNACMGPGRAYSLDGDNLSDVNGLRGTFDHNGTVWVSAPRNWSGPYNQGTCQAKYEDPC